MFRYFSLKFVTIDYGEEISGSDEELGDDGISYLDSIGVDVNKLLAPFYKRHERKLRKKATKINEPVEKVIKNTPKSKAFQNPNQLSLFEIEEIKKSIISRITF